MKEVVLLRGTEPHKVLQRVIEEKKPALMCYLSRGKWHKAQVLLVNLDSEMLDVKVLPTGCGSTALEQFCGHSEKPHPVNVKLGQSVGLSVKCEGGKFIFEAEVMDFGVSSPTGGGIITLEIPDQMEMISRRSYFRVRVPEKILIDVQMWHRRCRRLETEPERRWHGRLIDISAGGLQVVVEASKRPDFRQGQFVKVRFCPLPSETAIEFSAQIRNVLPTADGEGLCFGLQVVGLEASREGREILARLAAVTELYYELNRGRDVGQRSSQATFHTQTYLKRCRSGWGDLLHQ